MTPVACLATGHRKNLVIVDVHFFRLLRSSVGTPGQTNWLNPWHEFLYDWNARVAKYDHEARVLTWPPRNLQQYWHLCSYIAGLPDARWVSRSLAWRPRNKLRRAPLRIWHSAAETVNGSKYVTNWQKAAMNRQDWYKYTSASCFVIFQN